MMVVAVLGLWSCSSGPVEWVCWQDWMPMGPFSEVWLCRQGLPLCVDELQPIDFGVDVQHGSRNRSSHSATLAVAAAATQPLCQSGCRSHSATLPEWLPQPLSHSATLPVAAAATQPLSHSGRAARSHSATGHSGRAARSHSLSVCPSDSGRAAEFYL